MLGCVTVVAALAAAAVIVAAPSADAEQACPTVHSIAVGGIEITFHPFSDYDDSLYIRADEHIGWHTLDPEQGITLLNAAVVANRVFCHTTHLRIIGHSMGAAIVHLWAQRHPGYPNTNLVLLADPKRAPGPGAGGLAGIPAANLLGPPIAGVDANFGGIPTLTICNSEDLICEADAGLKGYAVEGVHQAYTFNANAYDNTTTGVLYR